MKWHYTSIVFPLRSVKVQALSINQHSQPLTHPSCNSRHHQSFPLQEKFRSVYVSSIQANNTLVFECLIKRNFNLRYGWTSKWHLSLIPKMLLRYNFLLLLLWLLLYSGKNKYVHFRFYSNDYQIWACPVFTKMLPLIFSFPERNLGH